MSPTSYARTRAGTPPRRQPASVLAWCVACAMAATMTPVWAQTAASTDKAQERSQQQSDSVYRWIKYFADQPSKARPKTDAPQPAKKPIVRPAAAETAQTAPATDATTPPPALQTAVETQQQPPLVQTQPVAQDAAVAKPAAPEPQIVAEAEKPLRPVYVVEPTIPREMRDEAINASVRLSFTVLPNGTISAPEVVSGDNRRLNRSALQAIAQWRFEPIQTARATQIEFAFRQE